MGIGLSAQGVNMNRLPGWDKHSYGYHGDDGHSFCSSGTGQPYGPTFTTGDVIGCCVNLINNTCFYTKNGHSLGIAFTDLPSNLYPTVGLQTPGEIVDANFGQQPFVFDIEDYMREWRAKIQSTIKRFPIGDRLGEWQAMLQNMVSSYLVHHGYCSTATAFARVTDTTIQEEQTSIKNRQRIQKLVLAGRVGEAIEATQQLYPGLLDHNPNLLFMLKCRQFVEMVNGTDSEVRCFSARSPRSQDSYPGSPSLSPRHGSSNSHVHSTGADSPTCSNGVMSTKSKQSHSKYPTLSSSSSSSSSSSPSSVNYSESNSTDSTKSQQHSSTSNQETSDSEMEMEAEHYPNGVLENSSTRIMNGTYKHEEILQTDESSMEDSCPQRQLCGGNHAATERMIQFGRELQMLSEQLCREYGKNTMHKKMLQDAFSLLAYSDPWNCPVGQQLDPIQREPVCAALNSAILDQGLCRGVWWGWAGCPLRTLLPALQPGGRRWLPAPEALGCRLVSGASPRDLLTTQQTLLLVAHNSGMTRVAGARAARSSQVPSQPGGAAATTPISRCRSGLVVIALGGGSPSAVQHGLNGRNTECAHWFSLSLVFVN
ncbi:ran-binding protein 10 isoform X4 [Falco naumanni]|nr:ran-binding protein 10 isoform X4 [Falco naumanni]XP_040471595.1 ran-binding protein 10 isoform X4 [Falco naumanni]XP_040471596.1 ran-binding protein 10 isoform X4 [Falco naumanni]XP_040471597.1 ran-binding protein 10 isoform X4 [Falco naumanni]